MTKEEILVTLLCSTQLLHETLDELQDTPFYRHSLKNAAVKFEKELTKVCDPVINISFPNDPDAFNAITEGISLVSKKLAKMRPDEIAFLLQKLDSDESS